MSCLESCPVWLTYFLVVVSSRTHITYESVGGHVIRSLYLLEGESVVEYSWVSVLLSLMGLSNLSWTHPLA
jgi:hypothetical protein